MAERLQSMGQPNYRDGFELTLQPQMLELPLQWKKPQTIFVNSMSDLFHEDVPVTYIHRVFGVMGRAHWHRPGAHQAPIGLQRSAGVAWPANVDGRERRRTRLPGRVDDLHQRRCPCEVLVARATARAARRAESAGIDWVIVGGESGPRARAIDQLG